MLLEIFTRDHTPYNDGMHIIVYYWTMCLFAQAGGEGTSPCVLLLVGMSLGSNKKTYPTQ